MRFAFVLLIIFALGCRNPQAPVPFVIGHVADLSGPGRKPGDSATLGIRLALDDLNSDTTERPIVVRHADTQGKADTIEPQAVRLLAVNKAIALLGGRTSEDASRLDRARPLGVSGESMSLAILSTSGLRAPALSEQVFLTGANPGEEGKVLARHAWGELKATRLAILVNQLHGPARLCADACAREFVEQQRKKDPKIKVSEPLVLPFGKEESLAKVQTRLENVAAVVLAGTLADLNDLAPSKRSWPILFAGEEGVPDSGDSVYLVTPFVEDRTIQTVNDFVQRFEKTFQQRPDVHAALAYENTRLLGTALRRATGMDTLREEIMKDTIGLAGKLHFDERQQLERTLFVARVEGDKLVAAKKYSR